jgi:MerR family transcriptional regulator, light-induced transcriptional regulator
MSERPDFSTRRRMAESIRNLRDEIAHRVTEEFLRRHPDWLERYGAAARARGREDAVFHLDFLAGAVEGGSPDAFGDYASWTGQVLASRGIAPPFLTENLEQIGTLLAESLSPSDWAFVRRCLNSGLEALEASDGDMGPGGQGEAAAYDPGLALSRSLYLQAILQGDRRAATRVVEEALQAHAPPVIYRQIVEAAQVEVGTRWAKNEITVAREHMATAVSQYVLGELYSRLPLPETRLGNAIITGVEGEQHQLGANMVADLLETEGWSVRFLGTQMPHRDIVQAARDHQARAIGISATMLFNLSSVSRLIQDLRQAFGGELHIIVGGRAFQGDPQLWQEMGAHGIGRNLDEALETFRRLDT